MRRVPAVDGEGDREEERGERHRDLDQPRDPGVGEAAVVAGDRAEEDADEHHEDRRQHGDLQRDAPAVQQPQELVPSERAAGAEEQDLALAGLEVDDIAPGADRERGVVDPVHENIVRAVTDDLLRDPRARVAKEDEEDEEEDAPDRDLVALEPLPDLIPVPACLDLLQLADLGGMLDFGRAQVKYGSRRHSWAARRITESGVE